MYILRRHGENHYFCAQIYNLTDKAMAHLSDRLNRLAPSATLAMSQKSSEMKAQGIDVINMSVGEPDFNTPEHIKAAAAQAIAENYSKYSPVPGYLSLRQAIVDKLKRENGLEYHVEEVLVSNGAKQSVCNVVMALVNAGDEVIIPSPYWVSYPQIVKLADGVPVLVETEFEHGFKMTPEQLEAAITPKTRMLILCSPCNPTGSVYTQEELEALVEVVLRHEDLYVVSDEIYEHINYIGHHSSIATVKGMRERTIVVGCNKLQGQYTSGACSVSQKAAEAAYTMGQECVEEMRKAFEKRRDLIVDLLRKIPGLEANKPDGAFYVFPKCSAFFGKSDGKQVIKNATDFALYLLEQAHVATVSGDAFGHPACFRLSYAMSETQITEAIRRIAAALMKLQ